MEPIYSINFSALNAEERVEFMDDLRDSMKASFQKRAFFKRTFGAYFDFYPLVELLPNYGAGGTNTGNFRYCNAKALGFSGG